MESVDTIAGGDVVVTFVTRSAAEQVRFLGFSLMYLFTNTHSSF